MTCLPCNRIGIACHLPAAILLIIAGCGGQASQQAWVPELERHNEIEQIEPADTGALKHGSPTRPPIRITNLKLPNLSRVGHDDITPFNRSILQRKFEYVVRPMLHHLTDRHRYIRIQCFLKVAEPHHFVIVRSTGIEQHVLDELIKRLNQLKIPRSKSRDVILQSEIQIEPLI